MAWFSRRKTRSEAHEPLDLITGEHRAPGLTVVAEELAKHKASALLDLGISSTENLRVLSEWAEEVTVLDLARDGHATETVKARAGAARPAPFRLPDDALQELPAVESAAAGRAIYDAVLLWDLLSYVEPRAVADFLARVLGQCRPGCLVWLLAADRAPIPPTPIRFHLLGPDRLEYIVDEAPRVAAPGLTVRRLEKWMAGCETLRLFQLRNGLQEMVFRVLDTPEPRRGPRLEERALASRSDSA